MLGYNLDGEMGVGGEGAQEERDTCIFVADSHCCMIKINTAWESNYPPIKKKKLKPFHTI